MLLTVQSPTIYSRWWNATGAAMNMFVLVWMTAGIITPALGAEPIHIAAIFSLTGSAAESHLPSVLGARWAVADINAGGGVLGRALALTEIDNRSTPVGSKVAADQAVAADVTAIIGPAWSSQALAVARVAQRAGVPMIVNSATHPDVTRVGDSIFRVCYTDQLQGQVMAAFAFGDVKARRAVILQDMTSDYSLGLAASFEQTFGAMGGSVITRIGYKPNQPNFQDVLKRAKAFTPDIVFLPGHDESGGIVADAARIGLQVPFLGGDGWDVASFFEKGGNRLRTGYFATHYIRAIDTPASRAFVARHGAKHPSLSPAALSYDAVGILAKAITRAGTTDRKAVRDALAATSGYVGVTGTISFDATGDPLKAVVIMAITDGRPSYLRMVNPGKKQ
ncbi:MAG: ABC transporter substrate-binding protein [Pseudomonadota bacterium]